MTSGGGSGQVLLDQLAEHVWAERSSKIDEHYNELLRKRATDLSRAGHFPRIHTKELWMLRVWATRIVDGG